jgi:hypothetical protein
MDLLDRYLQAVKKHLPWKRQDDIIAELRANLESQLEDKESELGRPLTPAEAEDWIRQLGAPVQVASHYLPQQYLIGPAIYPLYLYVLRIAGMWSMVIYTVVSALTIALGSPSGGAVVEAAVRMPFVLMQVAAWVTLAFAAFEFVATRYPGKCPPIDGFYGKWSPSTLPPVEPLDSTRRKNKSYAQAVAEVVLGYLFLGWLLMIRKHPFFLFGPGVAYMAASPFRPAPIWITFYWWIVALNVVQLAWNCIELLRGSWERPRRLSRIAIKALGFTPLLILVNVPDHAYVLLKNSFADQVRYGATLESVNKGIHVSLLIVCAIVAVQLIIDIGKALTDHWQHREAIR